MSQSDVAVGAHISQAALSKIEKGVLEPSEKTLNELARFFGLPAEWFNEDDVEIPCGLVFHRKRAALTAKIRTRLEAEARLRLIDVAKMLKFEGRTSSLIERDERSPQETARALRKHWKIAPDEPIDNLTALLEDNNVLVLAFDFETDKIDGFFLSLNAGFVCIALNDSAAFSPDRRRFTLAHELGHAILHRESFPDADTETEADEFAAEFLAPASAIRKDFAKPVTMNNIVQLKIKWKISLAAALYRAKTLGVIDERRWRSFCISLSTLGYRKNEPLFGLKMERPTLLNQIIEETKKRLGAKPIWEHLKLEENVFCQRYASQIEQENGVT